MSYRKIIKSGTLIEEWTYENEPTPPRPRKRKKAFRSSNPQRYTRSVQRTRTTLFRLAISNLDGVQRPAFVTLTMREIVSLDEGWRAFSRFSAKLRKYYEGRLRYIAVPEFQERGAVHFHCLVWGLTDVELATEYDTRRIAQLWGWGFVDVLASNGDPALAGYITKYMLKAAFDNRVVGRKLYSASRGLARPVALTGNLAVDIVKAEFLNEGRVDEITGDIVETVDNPILPVKERIYTTKWLGKCHYKQYRLI